MKRILIVCCIILALIVVSGMLFFVIKKLNPISIEGMEVSINKTKPNISDSNINQENDIDNEDIPRTMEKVNMIIKDGTLTKTGVTIIITDSNEQSGMYNKNFRIDKKENGEWKKLDFIDENYIITLEAFIMKNEKREEKIDWTDRYGKLKKGEYRLVKETNDEQEYREFWAEFTIW